MAIDFPASPTNGQTFASGSVTYTWDGTKWTAVAAGGGATDKITEGNTSAEVIDTGSDGRFVVTTEGTEALRVDASQRLLVGTSSAAYSGASANLQLVHADGPDVIIARNQTTLAAGQTLGRIMFYGNDSDGTYERCAVIEAAADLDHGTGDKPSRLTFSTTADGASSPTERMRITQAGFTKYSNTGSYLNATGAYHEFNSNQNNINLLIRSTDTGGAVEAIETQLASGTSSAAYQLRHYLGASQVAYLTSEGDWRIAAGKTYGNISDERKKTNIVDATSKLEDIKKLRVRNFEPISEPGNKCIGFIAQEFEQVFPSLVGEREEEEIVLTPVLDDDGNETGEHTAERVKTGESIKSIKETALIPILVKSLQEAVARIETLEAKVAALESA